MFSIKSKSLKPRFYGIAIAVVSITVFANLIEMPTASSQSQEGRSYQIIEGNVPKEAIEVVEVKNLQSNLFPEDFEIKIKNIGSKPIYGISIALGFPDTKINGRTLGYFMYYGDVRLGDVVELAKSTDVPIKVGDIGVVKMSADSTKVFRKSIEQGHSTVQGTNKMLIVFQVITFGDGTGHLGKEAYPVKRKISRLNSSNRSLFNNRFVAASKSTPLSLLTFKEDIKTSFSCGNWRSHLVQECCYTPMQSIPKVYLDNSAPSMDYCEYGIICYDSEGHGPYYCYADLLFSCDGPSGFCT